MKSIADLAVFPLQDVSRPGGEARMNTPSTAGGNWRWRFQESALGAAVRRELRELNRDLRPCRCDDANHFLSPLSDRSSSSFASAPDLDNQNRAFLVIMEWKDPVIAALDAPAFQEDAGSSAKGRFDRGLNGLRVEGLGHIIEVHRRHPVDRLRIRAPRHEDDRHAIVIAESSGRPSKPSILPDRLISSRTRSGRRSATQATASRPFRRGRGPCDPSRSGRAQVSPMMNSSSTIRISAGVIDRPFRRRRGENGP